jgi:hypothetical protein
VEFLPTPELKVLRMKYLPTPALEVSVSKYSLTPESGILPVNCHNTNNYFF